jgi:hypothetical protein
MTCSICLDPLSSSVLLKLSCDHQFHAICYFQWGKKMCPLCRASSFSSFKYFKYAVNFLAEQDEIMSVILKIRQYLRDKQKELDQRQVLLNNQHKELDQYERFLRVQTAFLESEDFILSNHETIYFDLLNRPKCEKEQFDANQLKKRRHFLHLWFVHKRENFKKLKIRYDLSFKKQLDQLDQEVLRFLQSSQ